MRRVHHPDLPAEGEFRVDGDEAHHLVRVLRAAPGDRFGVFDGRGREVEAEVVRVERRAALLRVVGERPPRRAPRVVTLLTAVPKGRRMEWLVEKCTEAGVARIYTFAAARGSRPDASANTVRRWERAALEAAKQCGRADVPAIFAPRDLGALLAEVSGTLLVALPGAGQDLAAAAPADGPRAVVVGPEGGLDDAEAACLAAAGARPFSLGALVLRIETAAVVAVHAAAHHAGRRG